MADMTKTTLDKHLKEVWSDIMYVEFRTNTVIIPLLDHTWEPELQEGSGDQVNIANFTQNAGADATVRGSAGSGTFGTGAAITWTANTDTQVTLAVNQLCYTAYRMPVEMAVQTRPAFMSQMTTGMAQALAIKIDGLIAADTTDGFDAFTAIGTDNVDVTDDVILEGITNLNANNAPLESRYYVFSPATWGSMMQIEVLRNQLYSSSVGNLDGSNGQGYVGKVYSLDCYMSNNLAAGSAGSKGAIFQKKAIAYAEQKGLTFESGFNMADGLFNETVAYIVYGHIMVETNFGREVDAK